MPVDTGELLGRLSEATGLSGYETEVRAVVTEACGPYADEVRQDRMGSVIALKRGTGPEPRPAIMLAAHLDEIGLIVTQVKDGFLQFGTVGGFDPRVLLGQSVTVLGRAPLPGIIGSRPPHVLPAADREKVIPTEQLFVDVGLPAEEVGRLVNVGDLIVMRQKFTRLRGDLATGKAMDDRAGVASLIICLEELTRLKHSWDVLAVATAQEEVGLKGAAASAFGLAPDLAIVVDVGFGNQPGVPESETVPMGKGPTIGFGPNFHPHMFARLTEVAKTREIPHMIEAVPGPSGTDAWAIQVAREGIPTCLLSIPTRYMHTPVETLCVKDVTRTGRLMAAFISSLDDEFLKDIAWPLPAKSNEL
jgi:tetrahedral aminopeptidase